MLMYTSCGWFFDELSGIETVQVMQYAGRAIQLAQEVFGDHIESQFLERLALAQSNIPEHGDGRQIYEKFVQPAKVDLLEVGAHYAISSLFEDYAGQDRIFCFSINREDYRLAEVGKAKLAVGRIRVTSEITRGARTSVSACCISATTTCAAGCGSTRARRPIMPWPGRLPRPFPGPNSPRPSGASISTSATSTYSLRSLFRDEQRKVLDQIMASSLQEDFFPPIGPFIHHHVPLMRFLTDLDVPLPGPSSHRRIRPEPEPAGGL